VADSGTEVVEGVGPAVEEDSKVVLDAAVNGEGAMAATRSRNILKMVRRALKSSSW